MKRTFAAVIAVSLIGGAAFALAQGRTTQFPALLEAMMERCRDMMGGAMMGGGERRSPNDQWRDPRVQR